MAGLRHRSRMVHATVFQLTKTSLDALGWITPPVNFGADSLTLIDYQPDVRGEEIKQNTLAITLGDSPNDQDQELGAGLRSAWFPVFFDVYMAEDSYSKAVCDDIRDMWDRKIVPVIDYTTGIAAPGWTIEVEEVTGPRRPSAFVGAQIFKANWHIVDIGCRVYYVG